jgi:penicillin-insensitive murein DD-endopeptidase
MRRLVLSLTLLAFCAEAALATEPFRPSTVGAKSTTAAPRPTAKRSAKAPAPKSPPAKELFGAVTEPAPLAARSIGGYAKGCLAGAVSLPITGPDWQVMRLSRNRNWGNPRLVDYLERLSSDARALDGWPGLLVGDMSQPRGGPMITGHASHQVGLDADVWLTPMPDHVLSSQEREDMSAMSMLKDPFSVDPNVFTLAQVKLLKRAASYPQVARIFVHPAIKKALCQMADQVGKDRAWLGKIRPWWNHHYHFHVRLSCPPGQSGCENQKPITGDDGCGKELANWYDMLKKSVIWNAQHNISPEAPAKPRAPITLSQLPSECKSVLTAGGYEPLPLDAEKPPAILAAMATKDAGPPIPELDAAALKKLIGGDDAGGMPLPDRNPMR